MNNSDLVLRSIFNQCHTKTNSVTAVQRSVQMGKVIFQEEESGRKRTEHEDRRGKKRDRNRGGEDKDRERVQGREEKRLIKTERERDRETEKPQEPR